MFGKLPIPKVSIKLIVIMGALFTFLVVGALGALLVPKALGHYFWSIEKFYRAAPEQPVPFPHPVHVDQAGIDCVFCHRTVATERMASIPPVEQCYFCHQIIGQKRGTTAGLPAVETMNTLTGFAQTPGQFVDLKPINWVRVHRLPDHVRFVHEAHVSFFAEKLGSGMASATCAMCHGEVGAMTKVRQDRDLRMGDCVSCHKDYGAPTDCVTCHY